MAYCGNCGAALEGGRFCPQCGAPVEPQSAAPKGGKKSPFMKIIVAVVVLAAAVFLVTRFLPKTVNEPCDWCGHKPSVAYQLRDGSYSYVCRDCSKECFWCGKKATKHYESMLGMMVFVCSDCYEDVS